MSELPEPLAADDGRLAVLQQSEAESVLHAQTIAALKQAGGQRFDPVRFQFIESMATRSLQQRVTVSRIVHQKIAKALAEFQTDFTQARQQAAIIDAAIVDEFPDHAEASQAYLHAGDFTALKKLAARLNKAGNAQQGGQAMGALATLAKQINHSGFAANNRFKRNTFSEQLRRQESDALHASPEVKGIVGSDASRNSDVQQADLFTNDYQGERVEELASVRLFRESLVKLNSDQLVTRVISEGPVNPGPLNPQALVIRSLAILRELSPDYLNRFVSYMDTLLWLEQASENKKTTKRKSRKKIKEK